MFIIHNLLFIESIIMLTEEKKRVLLDWRNRRVIASFAETEMPEREFPEEKAWRESHAQRHYRREVMLITGGRNSMRLNDRTYQGETNTLLLVNTNEMHDDRYFPAPGRLSHLCLIFYKDFINCQGDEVDGGTFSRDFRYLCKDQELIRRINTVWDAASSRRIPGEAAVFQLTSLINQVFFDLILNGADLRMSRLDERGQAVERAVEHIENSCGKNCSVRHLAAVAGFSPVYFQRIFRKITGLRVGEYIADVRMKRYQELSRRCTLKTIAEELGFSSASALCNWRKKMK